MLRSGSMFDSAMVFFQRHDPPTNQGLVGRIRFEQRESLIVHSQRELTRAKVAVILHNEVISSVHFQFRRSVFGLRSGEYFATIEYWT